VLCQSPKDRRQRHQSLLSGYLRSLRKATLLASAVRMVHEGVAISKNDLPKAPATDNKDGEEEGNLPQEVEDLYDVMSLVLFFYSYTVERSGMWAGNGNSMIDLEVRRRRFVIIYLFIISFAPIRPSLTFFIFTFFFFYFSHVFLFIYF
jgi:hypothetical protein